MALFSAPGVEHTLLERDIAGRCGSQPSVCSRLRVRTLLMSALLASQGLGTDEDSLIEIICSRTNQELQEINRVYKESE